MTAADPSYTALRDYHRCTTSMLADPELTEDLLLIGLWLARAVHLHIPDPTNAEWHLSDIAADLFPLRTKPAMSGFGHAEGQTTGRDVWKVFDLLKSDIRRYDARADQPRPPWARTPCSGPVVRRAECGKPSVTQGYFTDVNTGRRRLAGGCRKHEQWFQAAWQENRAAVRDAAEIPRPPANAGGKLARHLPDIDWPVLWRGLDKNWVAPPEVNSWAKPSLRVLVSPDMAADSRPARPDSAFPRPKFALIDGGQR